VLIGGGAASILLEDEGLEFRATKDVDLVVLTRTDELNARIVSYVKDGKYGSREETTGTPKYYRFKNPEDKNCPKVIEIFARNELGLELGEGQHVVPLTEGSAEEKLSAILLDDEYFALIQGNLAKTESGIPVINALANICLKARAHRELFDRKAGGDPNVDDKDIQKHLKDIWRLAAVLTGEERIELTKTPRADMVNAVGKLDALPDAQFKQVMEKTPGAQRDQLMAAVKKVFKVPS
jgi:hypothetical protein